MKKILVTTDLSTASKAGMRFAIQLATQWDVKLVFFHSFQALIPSLVLNERIKKALETQGNADLKKLEVFVEKVHKSMKVQAGAHHCVVVEDLDPERAILEYAQKHNFDFICMSTHGAGVVRKVIGTYSGNVLRKSPIPVIVVPQSYRVSPIQKVLYASDLENLDKEMPIVLDFADRLKIKTDLAHFYFPGEISLNPEDVSKLWQMKYAQLGGIYLKPYHVDLSFSGQLAALVKDTKPSIVVFFTHTSKTWFEKIFGISFSEKVSFETKVPMLVYRKK